MSENPHDNLDYNLQILREAVYEQKDCYRFEPKMRSTVSIDDLRKDSNFDYLHVFDKGVTFKFLRKVNERYEYKRYSKSKDNCTLSIGFQNKNYGKNDMTRPELYDMLTMYLLSELAMNESVNHVLLPLMCFDIKSEDLIKLLPDVKKDIPEIEPNKNMYVIVTENYNSIKTLREYLDENLQKLELIDFQVLFFQILFTLTKILEKLPKFKHLSLSLDSIKIYETDKNNTDKNNTSIVNGVKFSLPNRGFNIKISDFSRSWYKIELPENRYSENFIQNSSIENPYYDIHYITNSLFKIKRI